MIDKNPDNNLALKRRQTIILTNDGLVTDRNMAQPASMS